MRSMIAAAAFALLLGGVAQAAPTCQTETGETIRCGAPGAMPVGWTLPDDQRAVAQADDPPVDGQLVFSVICFLGGLFALIAVLPDFDGWREGDRDGRRPERPRRRRPF
jgi:hypothetical protein